MKCIRRSFYRIKYQQLVTKNPEGKTSGIFYGIVLKLFSYNFELECALYVLVALYLSLEFAELLDR